MVIHIGFIGLYYYPRRNFVDRYLAAVEDALLMILLGWRRESQKVKERGNRKRSRSNRRCLVKAISTNRGQATMVKITWKSIGSV